MGLKLRISSIAAFTVGAAIASAQTAPTVRVERQAVPGGAELLTVFGSLPDRYTKTAETDVPLLSVLRDTLGDKDPENDQLRYVWVLTAPRPTLLQRAAAATPFYYWRAGAAKDSGRRPSPVLNLSAPGETVWKSLAGSVAQLVAFDTNGAVLRSATRSYRNNARDHRQLHLLSGLATLSQLEDLPNIQNVLTEPELLSIQARLALSARTFGGFVSDANLPLAYIKQRTKTTEDRAHNWELLRQRAEANGLYFEPFGLSDSLTQALLWIAKDDLDSNHPFDSQLLGISNPYGDARLKKHASYTKLVHHEQGTTRELIPLALYALDHPKAPLLLVDYRNTRAPKKREMLRRAAVDTVAGVIGYSKWADWPYLAGTSAWDFVRARHGAPNDRLARLKAYSQTRRWLAMDPEISPDFREDLLHRLDALGTNPLEDNIFDETRFAKAQYAALLQYAMDPDGLEVKMLHDRNAEVRRYEHNLGARIGLRTATLFTLGIYKHREDDTAIWSARLDQHRRAARLSAAAGKGVYIPTGQTDGNALR
ncbi:MAG: hypothetical protein ABL995_16675 [Bryobacteraceae bacterium]